MEEEKVTIYTVQDQHGSLMHLSRVGAEKTLCGLDVDERKGVHYEYNEYVLRLPAGTYCTACNIAVAAIRIKLAAALFGSGYVNN